MNSTDLDIDDLYEDAVSLLKELIATPSFSKKENFTADIIQQFLESQHIPVQKTGNNIWAFNKNFDPSKPSILLNSHHDTVKPNSGYSLDPFQPIVQDGKLFGLGSNDAGGCLVSLIATFLYFYPKEIPYNIFIAASAEEEISGTNGIESILVELPEFELAIVGEPTLMKLAVAEKGLMVIDATVYGIAGHAAREEGENALYKALEDLNRIKDFEFKRLSPFLGKTKVTATLIQAGTQHNVVPDKCIFTLDVRVTDSYTLDEAFEELQSALKADLKPRSKRLNSTKVPFGHKILSVANDLGLEQFGSPTLSDQALIPFPSVKIGPGDSARSHSPDEFIFLEEIKNGIKGYIDLLTKYISI